MLALIWKTLAKWTVIAALLVAGYWRIYASGKSAEAAEQIAKKNNARKTGRRSMRKLLLWMPLVVAMSFATGCATSGSGCAGFRQINPTHHDVETMSDAQVSEVLAHNKAGERMDCWKRHR